MEGVKMETPSVNLRPLSSPVIELSQNTGLLLDNTLIHIPDSDTPPPPPLRSDNNSSQVPSRQVPLTNCHTAPPFQQQQPQQPFHPTTLINQMRNTNDGAFSLQDSMMPFDPNDDKSRMSVMDSQQKGAKKMKREIHATTATGTLPLRKINKRDATELDFKNAPKAPRSAYQIYLLHRKTEISIEQGKPIKITNEIVRQIGTEWSGLPKKSQLKASFENKAEEDKQRYLKELAHFLKTEPYLEFLKGKTDGGPVETIDQYIDREQETLNCLICNQIFSTSHNKKEHLLGRGHLLKLMNGFDQFKTVDKQTKGQTTIKRSSQSTAGTTTDPPTTTTNNATTQNPTTTTTANNNNNALISATTSYSPTSFRDNLHTDSSNATTEDYWNSPIRSTMTPDTCNNHQSLPNNNSVKPQTGAVVSSSSLSSSTQPETSSSAAIINHTRDALLGALGPSVDQPEPQSTNFQNSGFLFDMDPETEKNDFDMTKLDLPDDFNISHDYLDELQTCKLEQISPSLEYPPPSTTTREESAGNYDNYPSVDVLKYERQGSMESCASSAAEQQQQFAPIHSSIPNQTDNEASFCGGVNPSQQQFSIDPSQQQFSIDLSGGSDEVTQWSSDLSNFIGQQKQKDAELSRHRTANAALQRTYAALKAECDKLSQTKGEKERDNANLGEFGLSLQMQIQNLRNLPVMISQSRGNAAAPLAVNGAGYAKSPQSGDSLQGDATSSPSTYGEGSITSPMTHHGGNGLMSPLTPTMVAAAANGLTYNHGVFQNYASNVVNDSAQNHHHHHHAMFGPANGMQRVPNVNAMIPSQLHFPATNLLSGQWGAN